MSDQGARLDALYAAYGVGLRTRLMSTREIIPDLAAIVAEYAAYDQTEWRIAVFRAGTLTSSVRIYAGGETYRVGVNMVMKVEACAADITASRLRDPDRTETVRLALPPSTISMLPVAYNDLIMTIAKACASAISRLDIASPWKYGQVAAAELRPGLLAAFEAQARTFAGG